MTTPLTPRERAQWIALSLVPRLGRRTLEHLRAQFGSPDAILGACEADLRAVPRVGAKTAAAILRADPAAVEAALEHWRGAGITPLLPEDDGFPARLRALDDGPAVLFWRGIPLPDGAPAAAIVGTRRPTRAAHTLASDLAETLARAGWTVVSGLALGIDTAAHEGALRGGITAAVLGSGLTTIYPPPNSGLADQIAARGALLSEVHPDAAPNSPALVARNRLIAGLADVVIVVEAGISSGSLHAARFAQTYGRAVLVGPSDATGNRRLLVQGAHRLPADPARWIDHVQQFRLSDSAL